MLLYYLYTIIWWKRALMAMNLMKSSKKVFWGGNQKIINVKNRNLPSHLLSISWEWGGVKPQKTLKRVRIRKGWKNSVAKIKGNLRKSNGYKYTAAPHIFSSGTQTKNQIQFTYLKKLWIRFPSLVDFVFAVLRIQYRKISVSLRVKRVGAGLHKFW